MARMLQFRLVDAFAAQPCTGNPAGVVLDADGLSDAQMQTLAREINASETVFVLQANDLHRPTRLRWFTPTAEVGFCGHATLAALHALSEAGGEALAELQPDQFVEVDSAAGSLRLQREVDGEGAVVWWLHMPDPELRPENANPLPLCTALGLTLDDLDPDVPPTRTRDDDVIVLVRTWQTLSGLRPDMTRLSDWCTRHRVRGVCVTTCQTLSPAATTHSRFFAPAVGVPEDPVTGSVHGPLAALLVRCGRVPVGAGHAALNCVQGEPGGRTGLVRVLVEAEGATCRVAIGGGCVTTLTGELRAPELL